jgi:hypothetical protein
MMKKIFAYFISKLKGLGAEIVFANKNQIIFYTGKDTFQTAENYSAFILQSVISYPMFKFLNL